MSISSDAFFPGTRAHWSCIPTHFNPHHTRPLIQYPSAVAHSFFYSRHHPGAQFPATVLSVLSAYTCLVHNVVPTHASRRASVQLPLKWGVGGLNHISSVSVCADVMCPYTHPLITARNNAMACACVCACVCVCVCDFSHLSACVCCNSASRGHAQLDCHAKLIKTCTCLTIESHVSTSANQMPSLARVTSCCSHQFSPTIPAVTYLHVSVITEVHCTRDKNLISHGKN